MAIAGPAYLKVLLGLSLLSFVAGSGSAQAEAAGGAPGCAFAAGPPAAGGFDLQGRRYLYRFDPAPLEVGRRFAVEVLACVRDAPPLTGVDARMPAHRHGMNYRPRLSARAGDRWRADGLLLHMPGDWRFHFSVAAPSGAAEALVDRTVR